MSPGLEHKVLLLNCTFVSHFLLMASAPLLGKIGSPLEINLINIFKTTIEMKTNIK